MITFFKRLLRSPYRWCYRRWRELVLLSGFFREAYAFFSLTRRFNASWRTGGDKEKFQYALLRENHVIEKGMSMRVPRRGFGREKVKALLVHLTSYAKLYGCADSAFLSYPLATIKSYLDYMHRDCVDVSDIEALYESLVALSGLTNIPPAAGVELVSRQSILEACNKDFCSLLLSRHSMRYFSGTPVSHDKIVQALELAQRTPSACNRQGWLTHVFQGEESVRLLKWQGGCHGFEEELRQSVLVTANLKAFLSYEVHQAYVDGGLYAMNLINAFHSLGIGGVPLSCGFDCDKLKGLAAFSIPENEVPILIFAFGNLPEEFKVAVSTRKPISITNTFHDDGASA